MSPHTNFACLDPRIVPSARSLIGMLSMGSSMITPIVVLMSLTLGCGYGHVSPDSYSYAQALYSISNRRDASRLDAIEQQIADSVVQGKIEQHEANWLTQILQLARDGDWQRANRASRRMLEDQIQSQQPPLASNTPPNSGTGP